MNRRRALLGLFVAAFIVLSLAFAVTRISLNTLSEPSWLETYAATKAKRWLVAREARGAVALRPPNNPSTVAIGEMQFRASCAACHGLDGRTPSDVGRWMYPRASDLGSAAVQEWSDAELFWIIKHGIRLTGMPGFGKIHPDERIWHLVYYVRTLPTDKTRETPLKSVRQGSGG